MLYIIGTMFYQGGRFQDGVQYLSQATTLDPTHAEAHCNLSRALQRLGQYQEALKEMQKGHEYGRKRGSSWPYPSDAWVRDLEELVALDARLTEIQSGQSKPANADEMARLGVFCLIEKNLCSAAYDFFRLAFEQQPDLRDKPTLSYRYRAASAAFGLSIGMGRDAMGVTPEQRETARKQALDWMKAELAAQKKRYQDGKRENVRQALDHWFQDPGWQFIGSLPQAERTLWEPLWSEAINLHSQAREKK
jgi:tetratricopeptide (TPR) repeat protein